VAADRRNPARISGAVATSHHGRFIIDLLLEHLSVQDCTTKFMLERVKHTTALPV